MSSQSAKPRTFIAACLKGEALLEDIDDWVDLWHDSEDTGASLDDFLGFRHGEGALWAEKPYALRFIVAAHAHRTSVEAVLQHQNEYALAARSQNPEDATRVFEWLRLMNRV